MFIERYFTIKYKHRSLSQDVQYADIDHMYKQMDFTIDHEKFPGLNAYFQGLQQKGMKTIIILVKS